MTLQEVIIFFESLNTETTKKSDIKVYEEFVHLLAGLKSREFSKDEIQSIETELETLNFKSNREKDIRFFKKALSKFQEFLRDTFSLISKRYYTNIGLGLGSSFGILFGIVVLSSLERSLSIALGLSVGMFVGLIIGRTMDTRAISEGRVL